MKAIVWLDEVGKDDVKLAGGKGANLGELTRAGIPVPPAFIVTTDAYFLFLQEAGLREQLRRVLEGLDPGDVNGHHVAAVFAQTPEVPTLHREPVLDYLDDVLPTRVARTPQEFAEYGLSPLSVAPTPASRQRRTSLVASSADGKKMWGNRSSTSGWSMIRCSWR